MMAILRYAFLKSWRDRSLAAFMIFPALMGIGPWLGVTFGRRLGESGPSPREIAEMSTFLAGATAITLASMFAFWTFRGEIATRSIGAFLFAARPLTVIASLILFATAGGLAAALVGEGSLTLLLGTSPINHLAVLNLNVLVFSFTAAATGTLAVTISAQPAMLVGALWGTYAVFLVPAILRAAEKNVRVTGQAVTTVQYFVFVAVAIVAAGIAAILLERRCAT